MVSPAVHTLVEKCPFIHKIHHFSPSYSRAQKNQLVSELAQEKYETALILHIDNSVTSVVKAAGIPSRIGPASKLQSLLHLTDRLRQNRSESKILKPSTTSIFFSS